MKKTLFVLLLALMLVAMLALPVMAEETTTHAGHCVCGDTYDACEHVALEGEWKPWDGKSNISEGGNYYLTQDVTESTQYWMGGAHNNTTEMTINLCLNGHSIDSNYRVFGVAPYVTLNLMNCSETESVLKGCASNGDTGAAIRVHAATSTLNLYGNIRIEGKEMSGRVIPGGGVIVNAGTVNMYGGVLQGMKVGGALAKTADGVTTYTATGGEGGVLWMDGANSKFTMYGGEMHAVNGYISGANAVNADGSGFTGRTKGGAIWMKNGASFTMKGGEIYGSWVGDGATVYANGDKTQFTMEGGTIYAGRAAFGGGAFKLESSANFTMTGGLIEGNNPYIIETVSDAKNTAGGAGGGAIGADTGDIVLKGDARIRNCSTNTADIGGAIRVRGTSTITLGGDIQVWENGIWTYSSNNIYLDGTKITVDGLTSKARVGVYASYEGVFTNNTVTAEQATAFSGDSGYSGAANSAAKCQAVSRNADGYMTIAFRNTAAHADHCVCGGHDADCAGHSTLTNWQPWDGKSAITTSGNYYLTEAPEQGQKWLGTVSNATANEGLVINLCLNGFSWYSPNRVFGIGAGTTVNIMNCSQTEGRLLGMGNGDQGGTMLIQGGAKVSMYDNVQIGSLKDPNGTCKNGGAINMGAGAEFYMYGGRITGRSVTPSGGGTVYMDGTNVANAYGGGFFMYDGTISDGVSYGAHGGNIRIGANCHVEILGGVIENGKAYPATTADPTNKDQMDKNGGNIYIVDDNVDNIRTSVIIGGDAVIRNGEGDRGGNIFQYSGHLTIQDSARIEGGYARNQSYGGGEQDVHINRGKTPMQTVDGVSTVNEKMACYLTVAGTPSVASLQYTDIMDASGLKAGAKIGINRAGTGFITTELPLELQKSIFTSTDPSAARYLTYEHEGLASRNLTDHVHCLCGANHDGEHTGGCDGYDINFAFRWSGIGGHTGYDSYSKSYTRYWLLSPENDTLVQGQTWQAAPVGGVDAEGNPAVATNYYCLNGYNLTSPGRIYGIGNNGKLYITNCKETGGVMKYGGHYNTADDPTTAAQAGAFLMQAGSEFGLYGNITVVYNEESTKTPTYGGVIDAGTGCKIIIDGPTINGCTISRDGGVIRINEGEVHIYNGTINGGNAGTNGGAIAAYNKSKVYLHGGTVQNGTAGTAGGNISVSSGSEFIMDGGAIIGGTATGENEHGGNLYIYADSSATITGGTISGGKVTGKGDSNGGNIGIADTNRNDVMASLTIGGDAQILGGEANRGANIFLHSGNIIIGGNAQITDGVATDLTGTAGTEEESAVSGGYANCVLVNNTMTTFDGSLTVTGAPTIDSIFLNHTQFTADGLTADHAIGVESRKMGSLTTNAIDDSVAAGFTSFDADRELRNTASGLLLVDKEGSNVLFDGKIMRFEDAVIQAAGTDKYIQLNADIEGDLAVFEDVYLDLNGFDINGTIDIDDENTLYAFDSTNTAYETAATYGKINGKVTGDLARAMNTPASFGHNYRIVAIYDVPEGEEEGNYSFHRIYFTLKSVVLTPYDTGINYKSVIKCSDFVAEHIINGGVKLAGKDYLYGKFNLNGGAVENVKYAKVANVLNAGDMGDAEKAQEKAETIVTAQALLQLSDGARIYSSETGKSLLDVITAANAAFNSLTGRQQDALETMYARYSGLMSTWSDDIIGNIRGSAIKNAEADTVYHCYCYGTDSADITTACSEAGHPQVAWTPWDRAYLPNVSGNYYLTQDYIVSDEGMVVTSGQQIAIDLNGHSIISEMYNDPEDVTDETQLLWVNPNGSLIITDTVGTGRIIPSSDTNWQTGLGLAVRNYGSFAMYGGTIDATDVDGDYGVALYNSGVTNFCGGTITGGNANGSGGIVYSNGEFNMYGGTIENGNSVAGNNATRGGGNVRLGNGVFTMYGGIITGGTAAYNGGNVLIGDKATFVMNGGTISGGFAAVNGGTIAMLNNAVFEMNGGEIIGGVAPNRTVAADETVSYSGRGAAIYAIANNNDRITMNINGGTIYGGVEQYSEEFPYATNNGGAIYAAYNVVINISNATIYAGRILRGGGAIKVEHGVNLTLAGNTVIDGNHPDIASTDLNANRGGAIFLETSNLVMKDNATIKNCRVDSFGGGIFVNRLAGRDSNLDISGNAKIINCYTTNDYTYGGGIHLGAENEENHATNCKISGNVMISGNTAGAEKKAKSDLVIVEGVKVTVDNAITGSAIGVIATGEFATGSAVNAAKFVSETGATVTKNANGNLAITSGLKVGYAVAHINPTVDGTVSGALLPNVNLSGYGDTDRYCTEIARDNGLIASVLAFTGTDGETALVISIDSAAFGDYARRTTIDAIVAKTGIPAKNVVFNSNHQHSTPGGNTDYVAVASKNIAAAAEAALANRAAATMQKASVNVNNGYAENAKFSYVRNYVLKNASGVKVGMVTDNHSDASRVTYTSIAPESQADGEVQLLKITRTGASTIIVANFQSHPHMLVGTAYSYTAAHADFIGVFRNDLKAALGSNYEVMYISGAGGNINAMGKSAAGGNQSGDMSRAKLLGSRVAGAWSGLSWTNLNGGEVKVGTSTNEYAARVNYVQSWVNKSMAQVLAAAKEYDSLRPNVSASKQRTYLNEFGIYSMFHATAIVERENNTTDTKKSFTIGALTIGDVAFTQAPYEMFDTNGQWLKTNSPFKMTIVATLAQNGSMRSGGHNGYIPSALGYANGGYSTDITSFNAGTGEQAVQNMVALLNELK